MTRCDDCDKFDVCKYVSSIYKLKEELDITVDNCKEFVEYETK